MSKPKVIGYHASQRIDDALMALSEAQRLLRKLLCKPDLEIAALSGRALDQIGQAVNSLKEIRQIKSAGAGSHASPTTGDAI